ncbi:MAG: thioredoxin [Candidatus Saccharimonadaceae bacterium]|jgi:thioredoxin 1|nr:thioredoxin [Candidatus Saccharimonadaceae bacterium]
MKEIGAKEFEAEVLQENGLVLVDFNADWCGPCQMMKSVLEEFAEKNNTVKVVGVNIDDNEDLAREYNVSGIPCMVLFSDGKETKRVVGVQSVKKIERMIGV